MIGALKARWWLVLLAGLLLPLAIWQVFAPVPLALPPLPGNSTTISTAAQPPSQLTGPLRREDVAEVAQRPLFVPSRHPPAVAAAPVSQAQAQALSSYTVVGIIAAPDHAVAMLKGQTGQTLHLRTGQTLEGWTLEAIAPNKLTFISGALHQDLTFKSGQPHKGQTGFRTNPGMTPQRPGPPPGDPDDAPQ